MRITLYLYIDNICKVQLWITVATTLHKMSMISRKHSMHDIIFWMREAEFQEFEPRLNFSWLHLRLYSIFQNLSRRSIETGFCEI